MAIIFDCLHILEILFSMKHVLTIVYNHLCALGPRFFSCSTSMSSMPAALRAAIPFLYSSSQNTDANYGFPSIVGSAGHEQMVCDLVGVDQTQRAWRGRVVG